jgi:hypothetical protein
MLHFIGQMYKSNYFTNEQMTKYEILADSDKVWEKTLTHFADLYAVRKAYGDNRVANSGFESAAHVQENSSGHSVITTESNLTRDLYVKSQEESLMVARKYVAKDMAARAAPPPANEQLTLLRNNLDAQRKQFELVMEKNSKLLAALSKGGGGGGGHGGGSSGGGKNNGGVANNGGSARKRWQRRRRQRWRQRRRQKLHLQREKTLPKLQKMGSTFPCGVFLLGSKQKQTPRGMEGKVCSLTGAGVARR